MANLKNVFFGDMRIIVILAMKEKLLYKLEILLKKNGKI